MYVEYILLHFYPEITGEIVKCIKLDLVFIICTFISSWTVYCLSDRTDILPHELQITGVVYQSLVSD